MSTVGGLVHAGRVPTTNTTLAYERWLASQPAMLAGQTPSERVSTILRAYGVAPAPAIAVADDPADRFPGTIDIGASGVESRFWCAECGPENPVVTLNGWPEPGLIEAAVREHDAREHGRNDQEPYPAANTTAPV